MINSDQVNQLFIDEAWQAIVDLCPFESFESVDDPQLLFWIAQSYRFAGLPELSVPAYAKALELIPHSLGLRLGAVAGLIDVAEWQLAIELLMEAHSWQQQDHPMVQLYLWRCRAHCGLAEEAEAHLLQLQTSQKIDLFELGIALTEVNILLGNLPRARDCLSRLADLRPGSIEHSLLGLEVIRVQWIDSGVVPMIQECVKHHPESRRVLLKAANVYRRFCLYEESFSTFARLFSLFPCSGRPVESYMKLLVNMSNLDEIRRVIALQPLLVPPVDLRLYEAECLIQLCCEAEAEKILSDICRSQMSLFLQSEIAWRRGDHASVLELRRQIYQSDPANPETQFPYADALLSTGQWKEAWPLYESRFYRSTSASVIPNGIHPIASDQQPHGRRVLVFGEQGIGDTVMMASMLSDLFEVAESTTLFVQPRLAEWFCDSLSNVRVLSTIDADEFQSMDSCYGLGSLPRYFRNSPSDCSGKPYLRVQNHELLNRWKNRLASLGEGPKIGIAWRGGRGFASERRSIPLLQLAPILSFDPSVHWINLQYQHDPDEIAQVSSELGVTIHHFDGIPIDMYQTASLTQSLDLVVTVQQTALHVAGSVGTNAFVLLPLAPEWRYGCRGSQMPWYSSVELFRQSELDDWNGPIESVRSRLISWLGQSASQNENAQLS